MKGGATKTGTRLRNQPYVPLAACLLITVFWGCRPEAGPASGKGVEQTQFDRSRWAVKDGRDYPYREAMVQALVYTDTLRKLKKPELLALLGTPDRTSEDHLYYLVAETRLGPWPLHSRFIVVKLTPTDSVEWIRLHE